PVLRTVVWHPAWERVGRVGGVPRPARGAGLAVNRAGRWLARGRLPGVLWWAGREWGCGAGCGRRSGGSVGPAGAGGRPGRGGAVPGTGPGGPGAGGVRGAGDR